MKISLLNKSLRIVKDQWTYIHETTKEEIDDYDLKMLYYTNYYDKNLQLMYFFVFKYTLRYRNDSYSVYLFCHQTFEEVDLVMKSGTPMQTYTPPSLLTDENSKATIEDKPKNKVLIMDKETPNKQYKRPLLHKQSDVYLVASVNQGENSLLKKKLEDIAEFIKNHMTSDDVRSHKSEGSTAVIDVPKMPDAMKLITPTFVHETVTTNC